MLQKARSVFLVVSGLLGLAYGLNLLLNPIGFAAGEGMVIDAKVGLLAEAHGAGVLAFSLLNFLAVRVREPAGLLAILGAEVALQVLSLFINLRAMSLDLLGRSGWGAVGLHLVLGGLYVFFLVTRNRAPAPATVPA